MTQFLLSADLHIRKLPPKLRVDNFLETLERKIRFICQTVVEHKCCWLVAGDFFDKSRPGDFIEQWVIRILNEYGVFPIVVPGQHDIPHHQISLLPDSGLSVLEAAGVIKLITNPQKPIVHEDTIIYGCPFGSDPKSIIDRKGSNKKRILIWHHMVINQPLWEGQEADTVNKIQGLYKEYDLILTGDNHTSFVVNNKGKWLVNPGSLLRLKANQIEHIPAVYLYDGEVVQQIILPVEKEVFNLAHVKESKQKEERFLTLTKKLKVGYATGRNLDDNMVSYLEKNPVKETVKTIIWEVMGENHP
jgi:DNA repair exonuclease SbcCD nuclease subunit